MVMTTKVAIQKKLSCCTVTISTLNSAARAPSIAAITLAAKKMLQKIKQPLEEPGRDEILMPDCPNNLVVT